MPQRQIKTTKISGGAEYAKVADRMLEFRKDWPRSKSMVATVEHRDQNGTLIDVEFFSWLWKDSAKFDKLVESGVTDLEVLRSTADANASTTATAKALEAAKAREKHQSVAQGRALAYLGYAASGDIASFEEMELYEQEKSRRTENYVNEQLDLLENAKDIDTLRELWKACQMKAEPKLLEAKDKRKAELEAKPKDGKKTLKKQPQVMNVIETEGNPDDPKDPKNSQEVKPDVVKEPKNDN